MTDKWFSLNEIINSVTINKQNRIYDSASRTGFFDYIEMNIVADLKLFKSKRLIIYQPLNGNLNNCSTNLIDLTVFVKTSINFLKNIVDKSEQTFSAVISFEFYYIYCTV